MSDTDDVEYTTIRITKAEHQQANERRKAAGMDWGDWITDDGRGRSDLSREDVEDAVRDVLAERNPPGMDIQTRDVDGDENLNQQTDPDDGDSLVKTEDGRPEECPECGDEIPEQLGGGVVCVSCGWQD